MGAIASPHHDATGFYSFWDHSHHVKQAYNRGRLDGFQNQETSHKNIPKEDHWMQLCELKLHKNVLSAGA